ncbi:MAG: N-6 DNA methylase [Armatimonadia bacterium]
MQQEKSLGQYFTPAAVVDLAFSVLRWLDPQVNAGRLLDLSCGEGAFLSGALRAGFAPRRVYGLDADARLRAVWQESGLGAVHLAVADGLVGGGDGLFDVVVGNPPFAGAPEPVHLDQLCVDYHWWRLSRRPERLPRELWFLERSLRLLKPGGLLAMVLPEGFVANARWVKQREVIWREHTVEAVLGLPRNVFRGSGTTVKTCLLVVRKRLPQLGHQVRLVELDEGEIGMTETILEAWASQTEVAEGIPWEPVP